MNGDMHLITFGRRLMSRELGGHCRNQRLGEDSRFLNASDIHKLLGKFKGVCAMGLGAAVRAAGESVTVFLM